MTIHKHCCIIHTCIQIMLLCKSNENKNLSYYAIEIHASFYIILQNKLSILLNNYSFWMQVSHFIGQFIALIPELIGSSCSESLDYLLKRSSGQLGSANYLNPLIISNKLDCCTPVNSDLFHKLLWERHGVKEREWLEEERYTIRLVYDINRK